MAAEQDSRKLVLMMGISVDGVVATDSGPVMEGADGLAPEDPKLTARKLAWIREAGAHLMGSVTYEAMARHWPTSTHPYAALMNEIPKVVFSKTLERADWPDSRIARGDLADEIASAKSEVGKDLIAWGGAAFAQSLVREDLVDEYRLMTHPIVVGKGYRLFTELPEARRLELVEATTYGGTVVRVYRRA
jgi:dihydrofolate reductase